MARIAFIVKPATVRRLPLDNRPPTRYADTELHDLRPRAVFKYDAALGPATARRAPIDMRLSFTDNPLANYVRESREELRKVVWPTRGKIIRDTLIVVAISVTVGVFFGALDFGFTEGLERLLELRG